MKTLYIVRHAKASWDFPELPDVERPVIEKGIYKTKKIVNELNERNVKVDLMISSHAKRARETARIIAAGIFYPIEKIEISINIYQVDCDEIFDVISHVDDEHDSLMIVGHNPTISNFANYFLEEKIDLMPTSGVISVSFETQKWTDIKKANHSINFVLIPKTLN